MNKETFTIIDDGTGIEMLVTGEYEVSEGYTEECHGSQRISDGVSVDITHVEIMIANTAIQLLPQLDKKQLIKIEQIFIEQLELFQIKKAA